MELKDFIEKTVTGILEATGNLQAKFEHTDAVINPPVPHDGSLVFEEGSTAHTSRRIELVEFDLAVTVSSDFEGGADAGIKILGAKVGGEGKSRSSNEEVSRVRFAMPVALTASNSEVKNREKREEYYHRASVGL